jgi:Flp pilus assembly protein TadG
VRSCRQSAQHFDNTLLLILNASGVSPEGARATRRLAEPAVMFKRIGKRFARRMSHLARGRVVRRLAKDEKGIAAVEFAIVAAPFLALMFAIMETAIVFFAGQTLETAVADSARLIMTGQAQSQNFSQAQFKNAVCSRVLGLFDCQNGIKIDVKTYSGFGTVSTAKPIDANGNLTNNFGYDPGGPGSIVVVRLMYQWPIYVSLLGFNLADMSGNKRLIMATAAFRNEPYQ